MGPNGVAERIPGLPPTNAETGEDDVKIQQKRAALTSLEEQINRVDELYANGFKDEAYGIFSSLSEYLPSDEASQLNAAGAGLAEQGLAAFRVPGVGSQSDAELRHFVEANRPSSWDRDVAIEEKLRQLRTRVDATRAEMGLPEAQWRQQVIADGGQTVERAGKARQIDDPALTGLKGEYLRRLEAGQSPTQLFAWMKRAGVPMDKAFMQAVVEQVKFRRERPDVPVSKYNIDAFDDRFVATTGFNDWAGRIADRPGGAGAMHAASAITGNNLDSIVGLTGGNAEQVNIALEDASRAQPMASLAGGISGGVTAALSGEATLARMGFNPGFLRALGADTAYGAYAGAGAADDGNRLAGAVTGLGAGAIGSTAGQAITRSVGNALHGVSDPSVNAVRAYAPTTIGQTVGRSGRLGEAVKGAEDRISGIPVVGDIVNARRAEGVRAMNSKAFNKALEPINESVGNTIGEEAVADAQDKISQAFQRALAGKAAQIDRPFLEQARAAMGAIKRIPRIGDEIAQQIDSMDIFNPDNLALSGENMQTLLGSLRQIRQAYRGDPLSHQVNNAVKGIERAVEGMFERQAPEVMPQYRAAKEAYRRLSTIADAVNRGKNSEGVFTPGQLGMADRANSKKHDGALNAAAGKSPFHQFQRDAQNVFPNRVPDSGTAGRLIVPGALAMGGTGLGAAAGDTQSGAMTGVGLATLLSFAYSRQGQKILSATMAKRGPKTRAIGQKVKKQARLAGATGTGVAVSQDD